MVHLRHRGVVGHDRHAPIALLFVVLRHVGSRRTALIEIQRLLEVLHRFFHLGRTTILNRDLRLGFRTTLAKFERTLVLDLLVLRRCCVLRLKGGCCTGANTLDLEAGTAWLNLQRARLTPGDFAELHFRDDLTIDTALGLPLIHI